MAQSNDVIDLTGIDYGNLKFGTSLERPGVPYNGQMYFDSTLGFPIWYNGLVWVNSNGSTI